MSREATTIRAALSTDSARPNVMRIWEARDALNRLEADRDRLAGENESQRARIKEAITAVEMGSYSESVARILRAALTDSKEVPRV